MSSVEFEDDWEPLSEAEMKVIQAKQERSNKISKIMGEYLLKGYKMLATSCPDCDCILLQDKAGKNYCVACNEVEAEISKDDPACSRDAALSKIREGASPKIDVDGATFSPNGAASASAIPPLMPSLTSTTVGPSTKPKSPRPLISDVSRDAYEAFAAYDESAPSRKEEVSSDVSGAAAASQVGVASHGLAPGVSPDDSASMSTQEYEFVQRALRRKILWAGSQLETAPSTDSAAGLCCLVKNCAEAMEALTRARRNANV